MDANTDNELHALDTKLCEVCQNPALHRCGGCHRVYYCNRQHQREHWRQHRNGCKSYKIVDDDSSHHLVATQAINPGGFILQEPPLIWGPSLNSVPVCLGCGRGVNAENSRPCKKCGWPICSTLCETSPGHLPECRYTTQRGERIGIKNFGTPHPIYRCITILRCLYTKQFLPKNWKKLEKLEMGHKNRVVTVNHENERVRIAEFVRRFFKLWSVFSLEDVVDVCELVTMNSHEVPLTEPSYVAIYGTTSMMDHDCSANCSKSFTNLGEIVITAARPIQTDDHLSISYVDPLRGTQHRQQLLQETKFFSCHCQRCVDPTEFAINLSALKCQSTDCDGCLLPSSFIDVQKLPDWICNKCSQATSSYSAHDVLERIGNDFDELDKESVSECINFLKTYDTYLHENHFYCVGAKYALCQALGRTDLKDLAEDDLVLKIQCCHGLEEVIKTVAPAERRVLGTVLYEKYIGFAEICRRAGSENKTCNIKETKKMLLEVIALLKNESEVLQEGKLCKNAVENLNNVNKALNNATTNKQST